MSNMLRVMELVLELAQHLCCFQTYNKPPCVPHNEQEKKQLKSDVAHPRRLSPTSR